MGAAAQLLKKVIVAVALVLLLFTAVSTAQLGDLVEMLGDGISNVVAALTEAVDQ